MSMDNKKILVVEDDPSVVVFIVDNLEFLGYDVTIARNGREGLDKAFSIVPDLIVLDVMMPEMDGYEVCQHLKTDAKTKNIPILMLTAKGQIQDKVMGFNVGADDYLPKPYEKDEFESRVKALLRRQTSISFDENDLSKLIFLSYARDDLEQVEKIYQILRNQGLNPWMDVHNIISGEDWQHAIYNAIDKCKLFILILSTNSVTRRGMIVKEVKRALEKWNGMLPGDIHVIPIRLDDCPIPELVQHIQVADWEDGNGLNKVLKAIKTGMKQKAEW